MMSVHSSFNKQDRQAGCATYAYYVGHKETLKIKKQASKQMLTQFWSSENWGT